MSERAPHWVAIATLGNSTLDLDPLPVALALLLEVDVLLQNSLRKQLKDLRENPQQYLERHHVSPRKLTRFSKAAAFARYAAKRCALIGSQIGLHLSWVKLTKMAMRQRDLL